jgi:hypothetical protein
MSSVIQSETASSVIQSETASMEICCGLVRTSRIACIFGIVRPSVSIRSYKTGSSVVHSASDMQQLDISISDSILVYSVVLAPAGTRAAGACPAPAGWAAGSRAGNRKCWSQAVFSSVIRGAGLASMVIWSSTLKPCCAAGHLVAGGCRHIAISRAVPPSTFRHRWSSFRSVWYPYGMPRTGS